MTTASTDNTFAGSIPAFYERYLVPLIFEPYAVDLAERVAQRRPASVLEVAAGTGVVTRQLAARLPAAASIVATDLNQPMLDQAAAQGTARPVEWRQADAMQLPFPNASFDAVVCQFGVMFFPDKAAAYAETRRVLKPGGCFVFNVWDGLEHNEFADTVNRALAAHFPENPSRFMERVPHGYHDTVTIAGDLAAGGFARPPAIATVSARSGAASARIPAMAYCQGTPVRNEIEARRPAGLADATDAVERAIARRFGSGAIEGRIQARVIVVEA